MFDDPPRPTPNLPLDAMSVDDLKQKIEDLKAEIVACEEELKKKSSHLSAADKLFGAGD